MGRCMRYQDQRHKIKPRTSYLTLRCKLEAKPDTLIVRAAYFSVCEPVGKGASLRKGTAKNLRHC